MTFAIKILDKQEKIIGELMTATPNDVLKFINRGMLVLNISTNEYITEEYINSVIGTSDGMINID